MKRRFFIKAFAAACAVPVVAAKAIASHETKDQRIDLILREWQDHSMNGKLNPYGGSDWRKGIILLKPEDAPLYTPKLSKHLA